MPNYFDAFNSPEGKNEFPGTVQDVLEREFDKEEIESRKGFGNQTFHYPRGEAVIQRLNEAFGGCWSFCVKEYFKDALAPETIVCLGELIINHPSYPLRVIEQFAGKDVAKNRNGGVVNIANDYKSAASLALRKCAMQIGVGLYLQKGLPDEDLVETTGGSSASAAPSQSSSASATRPAAPSSAPKPSTPSSSAGGPPASDKQINFARSLYSKKGITEDIDFESLSGPAISSYINAWKELPDASGGAKAEPKPAAAPAPKKVEASEPVSEPKAEVAPAPAPATAVAPEDEPENLKRLREIAAGLIGQEENIYHAKVDKFILHIYKTQFSKELDSVHSISAKELDALIESITEE
jgi:hypothetical protein